MTRPCSAVLHLLAEVQRVAKTQTGGVLQEEQGGVGVSAQVEGAVQADGRRRVGVVIVRADATWLVEQRWSVAVDVV